MFGERMNPLASRALACESFRRVLAERSGLRVELVLTRNRVSMASVRFLREGYVRLRLHEAFREAPDTVQRALVAYLRTRRREHWHVICDFSRTIPVRPPLQPVACHTSGRVYDLAHLAAEVHATFFAGGLDFRVGWGRRGGVGMGRSIRYGSCNPETGLIRIHPLLDDARVPEDFIRYILFHEMLHLVIPPQLEGGRRVDHPVAFRKRERTFPGFSGHKRLARELLRILPVRHAAR